MKKHKVMILPAAWDDLHSIRDYIVQNDPVASKHMVEKIIGSLRRLETFPLSAPLVPDDELMREGYRVLRCDKYLCFYRLVSGTVFVYHITHGAMDYPVLLKHLCEKSSEE